MAHTDFYFWLLDILLAKKIDFFDARPDSYSASLFDTALKVHSFLLRQTIINDSDGYKKL